MPKGCKSCSVCGFCTGPRAYVCPKCNNPFTFKINNKDRKSHRLIKSFDWKELQMGDLIKINGGPYFMTKSGEYVPMGYRGKFSVHSVDDNGILAWGKDKFAGIVYIYMGQDKLCKETGLYKTAHKILKFKRKENEQRNDPRTLSA